MRSQTLTWLIFTLVLLGNNSNAAVPLGVPSPQSIQETQVIGGHSVNPTESPWQVALISALSVNHVQGVFCGGTFVDPQWILTAAHCLFDPKNCAEIPLQSFFIGYGSTDLGKKISLIAPDEIHIHEGYHCGKKENDIALIRIGERVSLMEAMQLPTQAEATTIVTSGARFMTTGWGLTEKNGWKSRNLMEVEIPIVSYSACRKIYGSVLPTDAICAGETGKDACTWDSGGPLYQRKAGNKAIQVGIVSFGDSCGDGKIPGVFAPLAPYLTWIANTRKPRGCTPDDIAKYRC
jgi:secreted trypsin-like serine protease